MNMFLHQIIKWFLLTLPGVLWSHQSQQAPLLNSSVTVWMAAMLPWSSLEDKSTWRCARWRFMALCWIRLTFPSFARIQPIHGYDLKLINNTLSFNFYVWCSLMKNIKRKTNESVCSKGKVCLRHTVALHRKTLLTGKDSSVWFTRLNSWLRKNGIGWINWVFNCVNVSRQQSAMITCSLAQLYISYI